MGARPSTSGLYRIFFVAFLTSSSSTPSASIFKFIQATELLFFIGEVSVFRLLVDAPNLSVVFISTSTKIMGYLKINHDHFHLHFLQLVILYHVIIQRYIYLATDGATKSVASI
jgi:hypothetical protein